jgi:hypothetical protein
MPREGNVGWVSRIDAYRRQSATQRGKDDARSLADRLRVYRRPTKAMEERRAKERECRSCHYLRGARISGQAFTEWTCQHCGAEAMYHCTGYPTLCDKCSDELGACVRCVGDR